MKRWYSIFIPALLLATPLAAGIPEPDNAVYGEITLDGAPLSKDALELFATDACARRRMTG